MIRKDAVVNIKSTLIRPSFARIVLLLIIPQKRLFLLSKELLPWNIL